MNPWFAFLEQQPLATSPKEGHHILTPLTHTGILRVAGRDALDFLQGQTTCDVRKITEQNSALGAFCNPEGRVIANFRILMHDGDYLLLLAADLLDIVLRRLKMFVLRSDVKLMAEEFPLFGVTVFAHGQLDRIGKPPQTVDAISTMANLTWIRMPPPGLRWLVLGPYEAARRFWLFLVEEHQAICHSVEQWQLQEIRSGVPWVTQVTSEVFLPQMLNLDALGAISFDKGCYTGQEIIARTHYLGQVKRRTYRVRLDSKRHIEPGEKLLCGDETVGQVVNTAGTPEGQEMLMVLRCDRAQNPAIFPVAAPGAYLQWLDLAYTLP